MELKDENTIYYLMEYDAGVPLDGDLLAPLCLFPPWNILRSPFYILIKRFCLRETTNQSFSLGLFWEQIKLTFGDEKGNLLTDLKYIITNGFIKTVVEYTFQKKLLNIILPVVGREKYYYIQYEQSFSRDQPNAAVLGTKLGCFLFTKFVFYPIDTLFVKFLTKTISFSDAPKYFTSFTNLKSLFCGVQYHLAYNLLYGLASCAEQVLFFREISGSHFRFPFQFQILYFLLAFSPLAIAPLAIKSTHDQAGIDYSFTWHIPLMRRSLFFLASVE